jgi:hypothetical protein
MTGSVSMAASNDRAVEECDDVEDLLVGAVHLGAGPELQEATGVGGSDGFCAKESRPRTSPLTSTTALHGVWLV